MQDRELLELAAKAASLRWSYDLNLKVWNPLENDADALRLAVRLGILLRTDFVKLLANMLGDGLDHGEATRRAIVTVAANIGKIGDFSNISAT